MLVLLPRPRLVWTAQPEAWHLAGSASSVLEAWAVSAAAHQQIWMAGQALQLWPLHPVAPFLLLMTKRVAMLPVLALQGRGRAWPAAPARPGEAPGV